MCRVNSPEPASRTDRWDSFPTFKGTRLRPLYGALPRCQVESKAACLGGTLDLASVVITQSPTAGPKTISSELLAASVGLQVQIPCVFVASGKSLTTDSASSAVQHR